ncbi:MAG: hypothetical protein ACK5C8_01425 [Roseiflexaceae bacterium]|jgi:hypothetical protein|nr:hypothetical protein [Chloroflexaceae bacterium]
MCGAVRFAWHDVDDALLPVSTMPAGIYESRYWQGIPVLPVQCADAPAQLMRWGNRNEISDLPATGWVKHESLQAGKWQRYHPVPVTIPVMAGYEQGVWFGIDYGIYGIVAAGRVFMLTEAADPDYWQMTHHQRMPLLIAQTIRVPLPGSQHQQRLFE